MSNLIAEIEEYLTEISKKSDPLSVRTVVETPLVMWCRKTEKWYRMCPRCRITQESIGNPEGFWEFYHLCPNVLTKVIRWRKFS